MPYSDRTKERLYAKKYRSEHPEVREYQRLWMRRWRDSHRDKARSIGRKSYRKHAERRAMEARENRRKMKLDPERLQKYRTYCLSKTKNRLSSDPNYKLRFRLRNRISMAMQRVGSTKSQGTEELIGCSLAFFRKHIESKWLPGMSWGNYGRHGWHLDHIIPCVAFDLTKLKERMKCFHYTNCQPLWERDNLSKSARRYIQPDLILQA